MRLTFRLKDAEMQIRGGNHLQAKFDLSSIRNKVISQNTRLYVEAVDTCDLRLVGGEDSGGYMEIRSPDIGQEDWDSQQSTLQTDDTLIFHTHMISFTKIQNHNPMYCHNFKVSQNFLHTTLTLDFRFYSIMPAINEGRYDILTTPVMPGILERLKNIAITLVLYDEIDPITEASKDAIKGQNIMRLMLDQFKRI